MNANENTETLSTCPPSLFVVVAVEAFVRMRTGRRFPLNGEVFSGVRLYKIIVTVTIGERYMQGLKAISQFLWDPEKDSYATHVYDASPSLVAVGTIYAIYFD
ncbi:AGAP005171-PA-like protein [Anopheles sinensis]|uniref:AGAP005171-PA-like protein n=1 Tax=Anopheles sinensis TaxID=74873 RepID=A0A084W2B4_ANOSI|nr:AGAP005171-PA-like protein [Anopheles sinensis]